MRYRPLGRTGIAVSEIAFGCGPVPELFTDPDGFDSQCRTIRRALEQGVNWFDTAATYAEGRSEECLGRALKELGTDMARSAEEDRDARRIHIATKVRLFPQDMHDIRGHVLRSVEGSLRRLQLSSVTLLQVHNSITQQRGVQPTSLSPADLLEHDGVLDAFDELQRAGLVRHLGLTGLGEPAALIEVLRSGRVATVQAPYNILYPSAGCVTPLEPPEYPPEHDLRGLFAACQQQGVAVFAIRVFAGGALFRKPPSRHTLTTKFFPLDLYERDLRAAKAVAEGLPPGRSLPQAAVQFALQHPAVSSAIMGCATPQEVEDVVCWAAG